jgi:acyl-CoA thioesterase-1
MGFVQGDDAMKVVWCRREVGLVVCAVAIGLAMSSLHARGEEEKAKPVEAELHQHLRDAFKNPPDEPGLPRVLLIGDSISIGYTVPVRQRLQDKAVVCRPPVNCQHTAYGLAHLKSWLGTSRWDVIHFNWGIWDTHMVDAQGNLVRGNVETNAAGPLRIRHTPEQYRENLMQLADILQGTGARLIWASTTPVMSRTGARFEDIPVRNAVAAEVMAARGIPVNDLYAYTLPHVREWQLPDRVHFNAEGNQHLAERVGEQIRHGIGGL